MHTNEVALITGANKGWVLKSPANWDNKASRSSWVRDHAKATAAAEKLKAEGVDATP